MVRDGYKQTEVGIIPEDWDVIPITKVTSEIFLGLTTKVDYVNSGGIPLIRASDIAEGRLSFDKARTISVRQHKQLTKYRSPKRGDVLVSKSGSLGVCAIVDVDKEFSIYESIIVLQTNSCLDSSFLLWLVRDEKTQTRVVGEKVGSTVGHLNLEMFRKLIIPLPSKEEQKAIAQALSDVDALICLLDKLIAKKRAIKTAAMQQLLTGKKRLPGFSEGKGYKQTEIGMIPEEWDVKTIGDIADVKTGPFGSTLHEKDYVDDGTPIITVEHLGELGVEHINLPMVSDKDRERLKSYSLQVGDIVFSRVGSIDRNALIKKEESGWLFSGRLLRVRLNSSKSYPQYLSYHFHSEPFKRRVREVAVGQTMASLNTQILNNIQILFPLQEEQCAIATVLSDMNAEIAALETRLTKTQAIKQGMMQELLTGRTRLV